MVGLLLTASSKRAAADHSAATMLPAGNTCNGSAADSVTGFVAERHPSAIAETGVRAFAISTEGTLHVRNDGVSIDSALSGTIVLR